MNKNDAHYLEEKLRIFHNAGTELERIRRLTDAFKAAPFQVRVVLQNKNELHECAFLETPEVVSAMMEELKRRESELTAQIEAL